jgi:hypothetical protein
MKGANDLKLKNNLLIRFEKVNINPSFQGGLR